MSCTCIPNIIRSPNTLTGGIIEHVPYIVVRCTKNMVEFDVMDAFDVDNAHDCESMEKALARIKDAGNYGIDF